MSIKTQGTHGSSPRPWGTRLIVRAGGVDARFIPTPVGNALSVKGANVIPKVHPHARGERSDAVEADHVVCGSSPRPWGTHVLPSLTSASNRFIPTPVGNAALAVASSWVTTVHPHARGERTYREPAPEDASGSSPRPWGTRRKSWRNAWQLGFIPTPVGNASRARSSRRRSAVHPHARGERRAPECGDCGARGSSPRPWGTRGLGGVDQREIRFIPTPVGNAGKSGARSR